MAVQPLLGKKLVIRNQQIPTHVRPPSTEIQERTPTSLYAEHYVERNNNIDVKELADLLANKLNFNQEGVNTNLVEVDIPRAIAISNVDKNAVKSEVVKAKVSNKVEKLKALRKKQNGS